MSAREFFNNNPAIVTGGAVLVLVICLAVIACQLFGGGGGGGGGNVKLVYYDVSSNSIQLVSAEDRPSSPLADNANAYRTMVLSCGECSKLKNGMTRDEIEGAGMFLSYLNKDSDNPTGDPMLDRDNLVSSIDDPDNWLSSMSEEGAAVMGDVWNCPNGDRAKPCP